MPRADDHQRGVGLQGQIGLDDAGEVLLRIKRAEEQEVAPSRQPEHPLDHPGILRRVTVEDGGGHRRGLVGVGHLVGRDLREQAQYIAPARFRHGADMIAMRDALLDEAMIHMLVVERRIGKLQRHQIMQRIDVARPRHPHRDRIGPVHDVGRIGYPQRHEVAGTAQALVGELEQARGAHDPIEGGQAIGETLLLDRIAHRHVQPLRRKHHLQPLAAQAALLLRARFGRMWLADPIEEEQLARLQPPTNVDTEHAKRGMAQIADRFGEAEAIGRNARAARHGEIKAVDSDSQLRHAVVVLCCDLAPASPLVIQAGFGHHVDRAAAGGPRRAVRQRRLR